MTMNITDDTVVALAENQVSGNLIDGEVAILNLKDGIYYGLNSVGGRVWSLIAERRTVKTLIETLVDEFDVEPERCRAEVLALLDALAKHNLVTVSRDLVE